MKTSKSDLKFLPFTKEGWLDYSSEELAPHSSYEPYAWEVFDWKSFVQWVNRNMHISIVISVVYIAVIFSLQAFMRNRKPFGLKRELAIWNGALGLFSIMGLTRVLPDLWGQINRPNGLYHALCVKERISVPMIFWGGLFVISKVVELGDTIFIVLRKKPVQFLQYFHHALSLTLAWTTGPYLEPICRFYILMNYGVHSLMYPYFALKSMNVHIPRQFANIITALQLIQMVIGVTINVWTSYLYYIFGSCHRYEFSIKMIWIAYGSFLVLFGDLFYRLVLKRTKKSSPVNKQN